MVFVDQNVFNWLKTTLSEIENWEVANLFFEKKAGIKSFFADENERIAFENWLLKPDEDRIGDSKIEFGDFQTNIRLARETAKLLFEKGSRPVVLVEPTFGKGNFIRASLEIFPTIRKIFGVEISRNYCWQAKLSILEFFHENPTENPPKIQLFHEDVFAFNFTEIAAQLADNQLLVIGNPPWVTNAGLSSIGSENLPEKSNFKKLSGLDALTGKGNFDLGETITLSILKAFHQKKGRIAFVIKTAVIKNVVQEQLRNHYEIDCLEQWKIDANREFGAAVEAAIFIAEFSKKSAYFCNIYDFYERKFGTSFGWVGEKFVADVEKYVKFDRFDGICPFVWRQGMKHDCSKIMELERENGHFLNGFGQKAKLENELVFSLLKSSDLKFSVAKPARKNTIITQRKIGQSTHQIESDFPQVWAYLTENRAFFEARKSIIYKNSPDFAIFGIGDYSFKPFKVAISGLYKTAHFSLVLPEKGKPVMLDDTCYFIGFQTFAEAAIIWAVLNSEICQTFLQSIVFWDAKRPMTKDLLMRIDLKKLISTIDFETIEKAINQLQIVDYQQITESNWVNMLDLFQIEHATQLSLFD
jgi:hypothetical protein